MVEKGHTVRCKRLVAGSITCSHPFAPHGQPTGYGEGLSPGPRTTPGKPQGLTAHAPAALDPGAGTMTPATWGKGARAKLWSRNGQPGTTPPRTLPTDGGVGESRPVKEGSRGRPGRGRHKTGPGPGKGGTDGWKGGR